MITSVGTRENLNTGILETGITGGFPLPISHLHGDVKFPDHILLMINLRHVI
jgi:hypothetical protein